MAFRYSETNASAGVLYKGDYKTLVLGFPFETILEKEARLQLMQQIVNSLTNQYPSSGSTKCFQRTVTGYIKKYEYGQA